MVALLSVPVAGFPIPRVKALVAGGQVQSLVASATFESEANVEDVVEETPVEVEPSVDVAEVAPEVVAAEMAEAPEETPEEDEADAEEDSEEETEEVKETEDAAEDMSEIAALRMEIAELKALLTPPTVEAAVDAEPVEPVPAIERSAEDIAAAIAALDASIGYSKAAAILAELDAKVG
jgi:hypothetical protein